MIPKVIHYCWFCPNPKPQIALKCMESWRKKCPDYEIIEWNDTNYSFEKAPVYVRQVCETKKWAFVSDYVRLQIIYENGGIYLDTDVELLKSLDELLSNAAYFGFQKDLLINTGQGFGAEKGCGILLDLMRDYQDTPFLRPDGSMDTMPCPNRNTRIFLQHGLRQVNTERVLDGKVRIFPADCFSPIDYDSGKMELTENTYSIHHFCASWRSKTQLLEDGKRRAYIQKYGVEEGEKRMKNGKNGIVCHLPSDAMAGKEHLSG